MLSEFAAKFQLKEYAICETKHWILSLRPEQVTLGSCILSLKRECNSVKDISLNEFKDLHPLLQKLESLYMDVFGASIVNYLLLMLVDKQLHFHIIPRYSEEKMLNNRIWKDYSWPNPVDLSLVNATTFEDSSKLLAMFKINGLETKAFLLNRKYKVGYTTGVFDLFHIGHLNILRRSKEMCDFLIVGVTADKLVSYKNKQAVIPHEERMEIVKEIRYVDQVVSQDSMNKMEAWEKYRFDAMFVGSDWQGTDKWNEYERDFNKIGVDIVYFPYTQGTSSTKLRKILDTLIKN